MVLRQNGQERWATPNVFSLEQLQELIEEEVESVGLGIVRRAARELALHYEGRAALARFSREHAIAYAAMRLTGTFAALARVARELDMLRQREGVTVLDIFAGPATAILALAAQDVRFKRVVCVERASEMKALGERLLVRASVEAQVEWVNCDVMEYLRREDGESFDLVTAAYGLGEGEESLRSEIVNKMWGKCAGVVLCVEPGTPKGAAIIQFVRSQLIESGGAVWAPCPHRGLCRCNDVGASWCHFSVRLPRSRVSRLVDGAEAAFEDEKFMFVALGRGDAPQMPVPRLVGHPRMKKGGVELTVCCPDGGVRRLLVPKRERGAYRQARKLDWGDSIDGELSVLVCDNKKK